MRRRTLFEWRRNAADSSGAPWNGCAVWRPQRNQCWGLGVICRRGVFPQRPCHRMRTGQFPRREALQLTLREGMSGIGHAQARGWLRERRV
jgi:hypothetical protein